MALFREAQASLEDWKGIVEYTLDKHGEKQTRKYMRGLQDCMEAMAVSEGHYKDMQVQSHTVRVKHCQKHYIFGILQDGEPMLVLAIFHERMELMKRLKKRLK